DHLTIWQAFLRLMHRYANDRELPDIYKKPEEFWTEPERSSAKANDTPILWVIRDNFRDLVLDFTYQQASLDSAIYPKVVDAPQRVTETLQPVRKNMQSAMDLLKKPGETVAGTTDPVTSAQGKSLRTFVRDYAYFLRRSCIDRPCGKQLDTVLKIIFQDDCFPYANSKYQRKTITPRGIARAQQNCNAQPFQGVMRLLGPYVMMRIYNR
ncbi:hypothetical protein FJZ28_02855, partial [Candidatus Peregrinibacteria bacterium]|nr:hypothetical protein [Candidatus Peregrinibacteria bacterium]